MGMSMTQGHSEAMRRLTNAGAFTGDCGYFLEGPRNGKDYYESMSLPCFRMDGAGFAYRAGYAKITADGTITLPKAMRLALEKHNAVIGGVLA